MPKRRRRGLRCRLGGTAGDPRCFASRIDWSDFEAFVAGAWVDVPERQQTARWPWSECPATREDLEDFRFLYAGRQLEAEAWEDDCSTGNIKVVFIDSTGSLCASFGDFWGDDFDFRPNRASLDELAAMGVACKHDPQFSAFVTAYVVEGRSPW
jgi:hypothetical protein